MNENQDQIARRIAEPEEEIACGQELLINWNKQKTLASFKDTAGQSMALCEYPDALFLDFFLIWLSGSCSGCYCAGEMEICWSDMRSTALSMYAELSWTKITGGIWHSMLT